jgi:glutathione peroxidase
MKLAALFSIALLMLAGVVSAAEVKSPLDFKMESLDGTPTDLAKFKGEVVLIVNVASKCGLTPQYEQLEAVYKKYKTNGFEVLGFPANQFLSQEPGSNKEISTFCTEKYGVDFPMFSKIIVKGDGIAPLYQFLTSKETNPGMDGPIKWNFEKFLVGRDGKVVKRFDPRTKPDAPEVVSAIEAELAKKQ